MSIQRRISPDPNLSVRDLAGPLKVCLKQNQKKPFDLASLVKPKDIKTSWKTAPDIEWMAQMADLFQGFAQVSPNLCLASSKLRKAVEKVDEEMDVNRTKMSQSDFADKIDTWLRICAAQYRSTKKKYHTTMKKAGDLEKERIDAVLALVEDGEPTGHSSQTAGSSMELVPYEAPSTQLAVKMASSNEDNSGSNIFRRILQKEDSTPSEPPSAKELNAQAKGPLNKQDKEGVALKKQELTPKKQELAPKNLPQLEEKKPNKTLRMDLDMGSSFLDRMMSQKPNDPILEAPKKKGEKRIAMKKAMKKATMKKDKEVSTPKAKAMKPMKAMKATSVKKVAMKAKQKPGEAKPKKWTMMFYKNGPAYAVRQQSGPQLFQITTLHKSPSKVRDTCKEAITRLEKGEDAKTVKEWAKDQSH